MYNEVEVEAFPTIPVVFLGGIREDRAPRLNSMGLAITTLEEDMKTVTKAKQLPEEEGIHLFVNGKEISGKRGEDIKNMVKRILSEKGIRSGVRIESVNHNIKSGSSDSGVAALVTAIDELFGLNMSKEEKIKYGKMGSESVQRSLLGGLSETNVDNYPEVRGIPVASHEDLKDIRIFLVPFNAPEGEPKYKNESPLFKTRITADEIHQEIVKHPDYKIRMRETPRRVLEIKKAFKEGNIKRMFDLILEDVENAHELLEDRGLVVRKGPMRELWEDVKKIAKERGVIAVPTAGGGNQISILVHKDHADHIRNFLERNNYSFRECKVLKG